MRLFLLGKNVTDDTAICDLGSLGDFVPVNEKTSVSSLDVPYFLENPYDCIGHALAQFKFFGDLH